ncbi:hypothetical protein SCANM63S_07397 [Streptomyces canarius]
MRALALNAFSSVVASATRSRSVCRRTRPTPHSRHSRSRFSEPVGEQPAVRRSGVSAAVLALERQR